MKNTPVECLYDCFIINIIIKVRFQPKHFFLFDAFVDFIKSAYVIIRLERRKIRKKKLSEKGKEKEIK